MKSKRKIALLIAALLFVLCFAGCGLFAPTAGSLIKKMAENLEKAGSVKADVSMEYEGSVSYSMLTAPIGIKMDFDVEAVREPVVSHMKGKVDGSLYGFSIDVPVESYARQEGGEYVSYVKISNGAWSRQEPENSASESDTAEAAGEGGTSLIDGKTGLALLQKIISGEIKAELAEETEMICKKEAYRLDIEIGGEILQQLLEAASEASSGNAVSLPEGLDLSGTAAYVELWIYKEEKLPAQIRIDCAALGNTVMQTLLKEEDYNGVTEKFELQAVFTEYNTIDSMEIPEEVLKEAEGSSSEGLLDGILPGI